MEAHSGGDGGGSGGGGGGGYGGEVRKVHIIYFLSHKGRIEQPHLIRVHHVSRNGVRLRDVKRWLSELRGKDMPESFAWSYKRKYKAGYVWQDLLDEDLITAISDNEYVLKGSEISSITFTNDFSSYSEKEVSNPKTVAKDSHENSINSSSKTSFEIEELPSFGSETSPENTPKKPELNSILENFLKKNKKEMNSSKKSSPSSNNSFRKSSSYSSLGATHMFLNLLTCGIVDTNESAVTVRRKSNVENNNVQVVKRDTFGGSERFSRNHRASLEQQSDNRKEGSNTSYNDIKTIPAAYKFVNGPYCSQCGRRFNPEKLHKHMNSCRRMKGLSQGCQMQIRKLLAVDRNDQSGAGGSSF